VVAHAHGGFGAHGHHHGSAAAKACIAVMTPDQRANLKTIFSDSKSSLMTDHQKVMSAKQDLANAILSKTSDLSSLESNLSNAKLKLLQDEDAAAVKVCGMLTDKQLGAAQGLYKNMLALHQSTHQQMMDYFKQARTAAGDTSSTVAPVE
jgi:Skp family chaperone for outer membrane proteins